MKKVQVQVHCYQRQGYACNAPFKQEPTLSALDATLDTCTLKHLERTSNLAKEVVKAVVVQRRHLQITYL